MQFTAQIQEEYRLLHKTIRKGLHVMLSKKKPTWFSKLIKIKRCFVHS